MYKIKDNVNLEELEEFGYKIIPEGIYAKSIGCYYDLSGRNEKFISIEKNRIIKKYYVFSVYGKVYEQKELHLFKFNIKDLIKADLVEKV